MPRISFKALAIAFALEFIADQLIGGVTCHWFAGDVLRPGMSTDELVKLEQGLIATTSYLPWMMLFGTATTVGGAYLAARIARRIPYYHGLAMGLLGTVQILLWWRSDLVWSNVLGLLTTIPMSLYGAHLARKHMPVESDEK